MSRPLWALDGFDAAVGRWRATEHPSASLLAQVDAWVRKVRQDGPTGDWTLLGPEEDFVARIPATDVFVSGIVVGYERRILIHRVTGS